MVKVNCAIFWGSASNQLGFTLYSSMLICHTNRKEKVPGAGDLRGETLPQCLLMSSSG